MLWRLKYFYGQRHRNHTKDEKGVAAFVKSQINIIKEGEEVRGIWLRYEEERNKHSVVRSGRTHSQVLVGWLQTGMKNMGRKDWKTEKVCKEFALAIFMGQDKLGQHITVDNHCIVVYKKELLQISTQF